MKQTNTFKYQRFVIAYHGCDTLTREKVVLGEEHLVKSERPHDWLGHGIYFWEHGYDRALKWAKQKKQMGQIQTPCVVGALIHRKESQLHSWLFQRRQGLIDAGILTKKGNVAKAYKRVIVSKERVSPKSR